jgi:hypothetical protein
MVPVDKDERYSRGVRLGIFAIACAGGIVAVVCGHPRKSQGKECRAIGLPRHLGR